MAWLAVSWPAARLTRCRTAIAHGSSWARFGNSSFMIVSCSSSVGWANVTADSRLPSTSFTPCELPYAPAEPPPADAHTHSYIYKKDMQVGTTCGMNFKTYARTKVPRSECWPVIFHENNIFSMKTTYLTKSKRWTCILALPHWEMACCAESAPSEMKLRGKPSAAPRT